MYKVYKFGAKPEKLNFVCQIKESRIKGQKVCFQPFSSLKMIHDIVKKLKSHLQLLHERLLYKVSESIFY